MLDTNVKAQGLVLSEKKSFLCTSHYKPIADNDACGARPEWIPGALQDL